MRRAVALAVLLLAVGGPHLPATAEERGPSGPEGTVTTLDGQDSEWLVDTDGSTCGDGFAADGFAIQDASLDVPPEQSDAYDDAFVIYVDGAPYAAPGVTTAGNAARGDPAVRSGLEVTSTYQAFADADVLRQVTTFANAGPTEVSATVSWAHDRGSDGDTVEEATSSGDTTVGADDLWVVSSDGGGQDPDPRLGFVVAGADDPATSTVPQGASGLPTDCTEAEDLGFVYDLTVPAGASCALLHFGELTPGDVPPPVPSPPLDPASAAEAVADESILTAADRADALSQTTGGDTIVSDLTVAERASVVNFDLGERADGPCQVPVVAPADPAGPVPALPSFTG